jgi:hypothetical protein
VFVEAANTFPASSPLFRGGEIFGAKRMADGDLRLAFRPDILDRKRSNRCGWAASPVIAA